VAAQDGTTGQDENGFTPIPLTEPSGGIPSVVADEAALANSIERLLAGSGPIAIDAERAGGYRYRQRAYLIQLRRRGSGSHLIDPTMFNDLVSLGEAIADQEWILHAASQDIPCLTELGLVPNRLFDTELAGRLLGRPRVGLAALTETELGFTLAKEHSAADWSTRPLPADWLRYAALDVELLVELRDVLDSELRQRGRWDWAQQEFDHVRRTSIRPVRTEPWRRTSGIHRARTARQLAIVREMWVHRDRVARDRDLAPGRVLSDAAIAAAAIAYPVDRAAFEALPSFQSRGARRRLDLWWQCVERAGSLSADRLPSLALPLDGPPPPRTWAHRDPEAAERLNVARQAMAQLSADLGVAAENLLTPDTVRRLCWSPPDPVTTEAVQQFVIARGARPWQVELTVPLLTAALSETPRSADVTNQ
jgi:ribonuclease D